MSIQPTTSTPIARLSADAGRSLRTTLIALALPVMVAAITAAVHWPALSAQAESFDDPYYLAADGIVANPGWASVRKLFGELLKPTGVPGYAHPLAMLSLMLDYATGGRLDQPFAFHRTNLVLHVATTVLIVVLLQLLFRRPGAAAGGGLLFGLHPVNVEIVAWIAQRKALLAGFFGVWCLVLYVLWVSRRRTWLYVLSLLAFVLATMSKPSALPLPVLLLVLDFWPLHRLTLRALREKVPFFALGACAGTVLIFSHFTTIDVSPVSGSSLVQMPMLLCCKLVFFLRHSIWPGALTCYYPPPEAVALSDPHIQAGLAGTAALAVLAAFSVRRSRAIVGGLAFFVIAAGPMLGIAQYSWIYFHDSYLYLPLLGLILIVAWALTLASGGQVAVTGRRGSRLALVLLVVGVAAAEGCASRKYLTHWQGRPDLYRYMLTLQPSAYRLHNNLGVLLAAEGDLEQAMDQYEAALQGKPNLREEIRTRYNLGDALARLRRIDDAATQYAAAMRLVPGEFTARQDHAVQLAMDGRLAEAAGQLTAVLRIRPEWADAHNNLGNVYDELGEADRAAQHYAEALRINPDYTAAHLNLGIVLAGQHRLQEAGDQFREVIRLAPSDPAGHYRLADTYAAMGRFAEAVPEYTEALRLEPQDWSTEISLGIALRELGKPEEALAAHRRAAGLNPGSAEAHFQAGCDLELLGSSGAAADEYRRALQIDPAHQAARSRRDALRSETKP